MIQATPGTKHLYPGCENAFEVTGHGKAKKEVLVHKCSKCGSKDAFKVKAGAPTKVWKKPSEESVICDRAASFREIPHRNRYWEGGPCKRKRAKYHRPN